MSIRQRVIVTISVMGWTVSIASLAAAKGTVAADASASTEAGSTVDIGAEAAAQGTVESIPENTVARCQDTIDNDQDTHIDCNDQDGVQHRSRSG